MNKTNNLLLNFIFIVVGGGLLIYAFTAEDKNTYLEIFGLILIMLGLYRATNFKSENEEGIEDTDKPEK